MRQRSSLLPVLALACAFALPVPASAGVYGDALGKCLVGKSSDADKRTLMAWIFSAIALNPHITPYASITPAQREVMDKDMAALFARLVGETCTLEAREAIKYEGAAAFGSAFQLLGQVAAQQMFVAPEVEQGSQAFLRHLDEKALQDKLGVAPPLK